MEDGTGLEYKKAAESVYQSVSPLNHITVKCIYEGREGSYTRAGLLLQKEGNIYIL